MNARRHAQWPAINTDIHTINISPPRAEIFPFSTEQWTITLITFNILAQELFF